MTATRELRDLDRVTILFSGDSGDGMQLTGSQFTSVSATFGNDLSTLPDFPAEIRAPAGSVNGVSAFQVNIADHKITTPGDEPNVLVAMNPAALKSNLSDLREGGTLIVDEVLGLEGGAHLELGVLDALGDSGLFLVFPGLDVVVDALDHLGGELAELVGGLLRRRLARGHRDEIGT